MMKRIFKPRTAWQGFCPHCFISLSQREIDRRLCVKCNKVFERPVDAKGREIHARVQL